MPPDRDPNPRAPGVRFDRLFPVLLGVAYGLVALAVHLAWFPVGDTGVESDFYAELVVSAQRLAAGGFSVASYPYKGPFYSIVLTAVHAVVGDWYHAGVILSAVCAGLALVVVYRVARATFGRGVAVGTALSLGMLYEFFMQAHKASTDMLFFLLAWLSIGLALGAGRSARRLAAAGATAGLAFLTRYIGIYLPVAALAGLALVPAGASRRTRARLAAVYLGAFLVVCAPWFAACLVQTGHPLSSLNLQNVVREFYGGAREAEIPASGFRSLGQLVRHDPAHFVGHLIGNVWRHFLLDLDTVVGVSGLPALLGAVWLVFAPPTRRQWALLLYPATYFLLMCGMFHLPRFMLPLAPGWLLVGFAAVFAAGGEPRRAWARDLRARLSGRTGWMLAVIVLAITGAVQLNTTFSTVDRYRRMVPLDLREAGRALAVATAGKPPAAVMARKAHVAYYAGLPYQPYPQHVGTDREFLEFAAAHDVGWIVYGDVEREQFPSSRFLGELDRRRGVTRMLELPGTIVYELARGDTVGAFENEAVVAAEARLRDAERRGDVAAALSARGEIATQRMHSGRWDEAAALLQRNLAEAGSQGDGVKPADLALIRFSLAVCRSKQSRPEEGLAQVAEALKVFEAEDMDALSASAHSLAAQFLRDLGRRREAIVHLERARVLYLALGRAEQAEIARRGLESLGADPGAGR